MLGGDFLAGEELEGLRRAVRCGMEVGAADPGGVDIQLHTTHHTAGLQDLSQARARWGTAADGFLSLFGTTVVLPGIGELRNTVAQNQ